MQNENLQIALMKISRLGTLTFGISKNYGFIEYMPENQTPMYLYANSELLEFNGEFVDFDSGGLQHQFLKINACP